MVMGWRMDGWALYYRAGHGSVEARFSSGQINNEYRFSSIHGSTPPTIGSMNPRVGAGP